MLGADLDPVGRDGPPLVARQVEDELDLAVERLEPAALRPAVILEIVGPPRRCAEALREPQRSNE